MRQANNGSTGRLALTGDRTLLAFTGAQDSVGVPDETTVNSRGVGTIDSSLSGNYTLQTTYTGLGGSTKNQTRSATSLDNKTWYIGDKGGVYTNNTTSAVNTTNIRPVRCFDGKVIACAATSGSASPAVLSTLSADATALTPFPGLEGTFDANAVDFYMIASGVNGRTNDIAYVNDGTTVSKYSYVSGSWTSNGNATLGVTADGICAVNLGGEANLYVTTGTNGTVVQITDITGYNTAPVITSANNVILYSGAPYLKGIDFAPVISSGVILASNPPALTAAVGATVDAPFSVTFTDSTGWHTVITNILVNSVTLTNTAYVIAAGQITFTPSASTLLQTAGSVSIVVGATGYNLDSGHPNHWAWSCAKEFGHHGATRSALCQWRHTDREVQPVHAVVRLPINTAIRPPARLRSRHPLAEQEDGLWEAPMCKWRLPARGPTSLPTYVGHESTAQSRLPVR